MNNKTKAKIMLIIASLMLLVSGCAEVINTEFKTVETIVVDEYHSAMWMQPMKVGKTYTYITHPARYEITVAYDGKEYEIDKQEIYQKYKDKVGEKALATFEILTYDNGTIRTKLIKLE